MDINPKLDNLIYSKLISFLIVVLSCILTLLFLSYLYANDNKYTSPSPHGQNGVINISEQDIKSGKPIFLIDGWLLYDGKFSPHDLENQNFIETFIGQYSSFSRSKQGRSPFGEATYKININYSGNPQTVMIHLNEVSENYSIWINQQHILDGSHNAKFPLQVSEGNTEIVINVSSYRHHYSGVYYPPVVASYSTISRISFYNNLFYGIVVVSSFTLAIFTIALWKENFHRDFGLMCLSFSVYCSYYFIQQLPVSISDISFVIEEISFYSMTLFMIKLTAHCSHLSDNVYYKNIIKKIPVFSGILNSLLYFMFEYVSNFVTLHSMLYNAYRLILFCWLVFSTFWAVYNKHDEHIHLLLASCIFGTALTTNLVSSTLFEPIYFGWPIEWCAYVMVIIFGCMMVVRNKRIIEQNNQFNSSLLMMVEQRTKQLSEVLEERKRFFSDMAHDLKAPIASINTYIAMMRNHTNGVDKEMQKYIFAVQQKQDEMKRKIQSLNEITSIDKIIEPNRKISIKQLLKNIFFYHNPEAEVMGIMLEICFPKEDIFIFAQQAKIEILFENLIYNALSFTKSGGYIRINCTIDCDLLLVDVSDNGCGIEPDKLSLIFERFYVGRENKNEGSGLGLYIVKTILQEIGGNISVKSQVGYGTTFTIKIPVC